MMSKIDAINCIQDIIDVAKSHGSACVYKRNGGTDRLENVLEVLKNSEPVRRAHWIEEEDIQICSSCGEEHSYGPEYRPTFCDTCGAIMDEEESDER